MISIHAPSRERLLPGGKVVFTELFQSTLPRGSDKRARITNVESAISIHAPSRERPSP